MRVHACSSQYGCLSPQCCLYETVFKAHSVHILKRRVWTTLKAPSVFRLDSSVSPACVSQCAARWNKRSTLYLSPPPAVFFFFFSLPFSQPQNAPLRAACRVGVTAEGCPAPGRPAVIIGDKVTARVSQCVMKANRGTLGCGRFVSAVPTAMIAPGEGASLGWMTVFFSRR